MPIKVLLLFPFGAQALLMLLDEFYYHRRRGLGAWERLGHPLDSMTALICFLWLTLAPLTQARSMIYAGLAIFSCFFVTKDEFIHARSCVPGEQWLHAMLFVLHPMIFAAAWMIRWKPEFESLFPVLPGQIGAIICFMLYQLIYWNVIHADQAEPFRQ